MKKNQKILSFSISYKKTYFSINSIMIKNNVVYIYNYSNKFI